MKKNLIQKFLKKAKKIIPGGNQLLSKRSEKTTKINKKINHDPL